MKQKYSCQHRENSITCGSTENLMDSIYTIWTSGGTNYNKTYKKDICQNCIENWKDKGHWCMVDENTIEPSPGSDTHITSIQFINPEEDENITNYLLSTLDIQ